MGIKLSSTNCKDADDKFSYIQGHVEYNDKFQRELAYVIQSIDSLGYLAIPGPKEDGNCYMFPGFAWTILMKRYFIKKSL